jgi:hypothetical protein
VLAARGCDGDGIPATGGGGTYTFASTACELASNPSDGLDAGDPQSTCSISSSGTYNNTLCGFGSSIGSVTINKEGLAPYATATANITYIADIGTVTGTGTEFDGEAGGPPSYPVTLAGSVLLTVTSPQTDGECTHSFDVQGSVTITE